MLSRIQAAGSVVASAVSSVGSAIASAAAPVLSPIGKAFKVVASAAPGVALVSARAGSAVFNVLKFFEYWTTFLKKHFNIDASLLDSKKVPAILLASAGFGGAVVSNTVTRFFNLYRRSVSENNAMTEKEKQVALTAAAKLEEKLQEELAQQPNAGEAKEAKKEAKLKNTATFWNPGVETNSWNIGYKFTQIWSVIYGFGSGSSGVVSTLSLVRLLQMWTNFQYNGVHNNDNPDPNNPESALSAWLAVNLSMLLLIYANVASLAKYNIPAIRENYRKLFIDNRVFLPTGKLFNEIEETVVNHKKETIEKTSKLYNADGDELANIVAKGGLLYNKHGVPIFEPETKPLYCKNSKGELTLLTLKKGWQEISLWNWGEVFIGTALSTIGVLYGNQNVISAFQDNVLSHFTAAKASDGLVKCISFIGAFANAVTTGQMTAGAVYMKGETARKEDAHDERRDLAREAQRNAVEDAIEDDTPASVRAAEANFAENNGDEKAQASEFGWFSKIIKGFFYENAMNAGIGAFNGVAALPKTVAGNVEATTHWAMTGGAAAAAIIAARNQFALDVDGGRREEHARRKIRLDAQKARDEQLEQARINEVAGHPKLGAAEQKLLGDEKAEPLVHPSKVGLFSQQEQNQMADLADGAAVTSRIQPRHARRAAARKKRVEESKLTASREAGVVLSSARYSRASESTRLIDAAQHPNSSYSMRIGSNR